MACCRVANRVTVRGMEQVVTALDLALMSRGSSILGSHFSARLDERRLRLDFVSFIVLGGCSLAGRILLGTTSTALERRYLQKEKNTCISNNSSCPVWDMQAI